MPFSFKITRPEGSYWISYLFAEPFALPIAAISALKRAMGQVKLDRNKTVRFEDQSDMQEATEMFTNVSAAVTSLMINSNWTENLNTIFEREISAKSLVTFSGRTLSSFIPYSGFWRGMHRVINQEANGDYRYREYIPALSEIANTLPWTPEKTGEMFGEVIKDRIKRFWRNS